MNDEPERLELLMMKAVDGELEPGEPEELERLLAAAPAERRRELAHHRAIKEQTDMLTQRILAVRDLEPPRPTTTNRSVVAIGTALIITALLLVTGFGVVELVRDPQAPFVIKLATGLGLGGLALLLGYVLIVRLRATRGRDPYTEIDQ